MLIDFAPSNQPKRSLEKRISIESPLVSLFDFFISNLINITTTILESKVDA